MRQVAKNFRNRNVEDLLGNISGELESSQEQQEELKPKKTVSKKKIQKKDARFDDPAQEPSPDDENAPFGWLWDKNEKAWRARKSPAGRKKFKGKCHTTNIDIPQDLYEQFQKYHAIVGTNLTAYLIKLMREDLCENEEKYKKVAIILHDSK